MGNMSSSGKPASNIAFLKEQIYVFLRRAALLEKEAKNQPLIRRALRREVRFMRQMAKTWSRSLKPKAKKIRRRIAA